ncbi:MAG: GH32 C-terminal domain-containing protein, partial [Eubacterium sp.]|nr:GH32 C-terminal domain-containing protein [Eubacterium sp.]
PEISADNAAVSDPDISGNVIELKLTLEPGSAKRSGVKLFCSGENETLLYYDREQGLVVFDRKRSGIRITGNDRDVDRRVCEVGVKESIELDLFLDVSSLEAFIDGGRHTMTGNVYPDPETAKGIQFFAEEGSASFKNVEKYDIG